MASDDTMTNHSSVHEDEDEDEDCHDHDHDHNQHHPHSLSRLSICTSSCNDQMEDGFGDDMMTMFMSGLSIESYGEGDTDDEYSDDDRGAADHKGLNIYGGASSDSDKEIGGSCLSLPGIPQQIQGPAMDEDDTDTITVDVADKDYYCSASETEAAGGKSGLRNNTRRNSRRRVVRERWLEREWEKKKHNKAMATDMCVDLGEIKGCRDLGFELGNQRMLDISSQKSCSTIDTASSGTSSPVPCWRISSPGDDPKDVKKRLKVWAQAVAASAARLVG